MSGRIGNVSEGLEAKDLVDAGADGIRAGQGPGATCITRIIAGMVPCQGPVDSLLHQYAEGLRRGMGYIGAATIEELRQKADFWRIKKNTGKLSGKCSI